MTTPTVPAPSAPDPAPAPAPASILALKIDIDTDRGCAQGLPVLLKILERHRLQASFFLSLGPDNMGKSIWRVFTEPGFLHTVRRRGGASTYGWTILFKGFLWPGPILWKKHRDLFRTVAAAGHEVGLHAWDHYQWQRHGPQLSADEIRAIWLRMVAAFQTLFGRLPTCAAAPGWRCAEPMLALADELRLAYLSDTRVAPADTPHCGPFRPRLLGRDYATPQLPTTLPTLDELIGAGQIPADQLNPTLWNALRPGVYNCHTVHAEIEGLQYADLFDTWLTGVRERGYAVQPLSQVAADFDPTALPIHDVVDQSFNGRTAPVSTVAS